ncbi:MAG: hypothetical protein H7239_07350 [Flavobacterium sp.]|nr:hypothetical protein [Flavobacterium sp.]
MKHILKYITSLFLMLFSIFGTAQELKKKDSITPKTISYGLRVGIDAVKIFRSFQEKDYRGIELVGDFRLSKKRYLAGEIGNENKTVNDDHLSFTTKGTFLKVGFDYNGYENWLGMQNMLFVGMRYGLSSFSQNLNSYKIYNPNQYFNENTVIEANQKFSGLSAQWIEVVAGIKAEVYTNLFVGFSVRLNKLVTNKQPDNFENLYIPGFNRTYSGTFGAGFNYTISYMVPIFKKLTKNKNEDSKIKKK